MTMWRIPRTTLAAALLALAGAAGAQTPEPVRIGAIVDRSSVFSDADGNGSVLGATMAIEDFGGRVLGRPVEFVSADHQNNPDVGLGVAREMMDRRAVVAILGGGNSAVAFGLQNLARQADRIFVNVNGTSSDLSNKACTANSTHWNIDTHALAKPVSAWITQHGGESWFYVTSDYTFGHSLQRDSTQALTAVGGKVLGTAPHPFNNNDFASQLLKAQGSGAKVVAFANSGQDLTTALKQAAEFGVGQGGGQQLVGLQTFLTNVRGIGLGAAQGLVFASPFEWNTTPEIEAFSRRFMARNGGVPPVPGHIFFYAAMHHLLRAIEATGTTDAKAVVAKMKELPTDDFATKGARIRADGRLTYPVRIMRVKSPSKSNGDFDYFEALDSVPGEQAFRPLAESECALVTGKP